MESIYPSIAIIGGTGKEGKGLALRWAKAGYRILIGSRQPEKARLVALEINQTVGIDTVLGLENSQAAVEADICVLTVVQTAHQEAISSLKEILRDKILVDATSRVDFRDPKPPGQPSAAEYAQTALDKSVRVVAAFQNIPAKLLTKDLDEPIEADALICSDDISAAQQVITLAKATGMRAYYAGRLDNSVVVEGLTSILISLNKHYGIKDASIRVSGILT
jgi:hypothetical protein